MGLKLSRACRTSRRSNKVCRSERKRSISCRDNRSLRYPGIDKVSSKNAVDSCHKNETPKPMGFRSHRKEEPAQIVEETSVPQQDPTSEYQCDLSAPVSNPKKKKKAVVRTPRPVELVDFELK
jgi:hypothetical protein